MVEILILVYCLILWVVFKVWKVPLNKWTGTTAVLVGVIAIGSLLVLMGMFHPFTKEGRTYSYTTPIMPLVRGRVVEVPVADKVGQLIEAGDVLFRVDDTPYKAKVAALQANLDLAQKRYEDAKKLFERGAGRERDVEIYQAEMRALTAQLDEAKFNLEQTVVVAPTAGYVAQNRLQVGMIAVPLPLAPVMTFVHADSELLIGAFQQNPMQHLKPGLMAEVAFVGAPGKVFITEVEHIGAIMGQGQLQPNGQLLQFAGLSPDGRLPVVIAITDEMRQYHLPVGAKAYIAVYSDGWHPIAIIRRVIIRIMSWENWLFSFMH